MNTALLLGHWHTFWMWIGLNPYFLPCDSFYKLQQKLQMLLLAATVEKVAKVETDAAADPEDGSFGGLRRLERAHTSLLPL